MKYHFIPKKISAGGDEEKLEHLYIAAGNIKWADTVENSLTVLQNVKEHYHMIQQLHF